MRRLAAGCLLFASLTFLPATVSAQESGERKEEGQKEESFSEQHELLLKWINFALLIGFLAYLGKKAGGPFFDARAKKIRQDMTEAEDARQDAERKAADVDRRLANLEAEISGLRTESQKEAGNEQERIRQQTAAEIARIRAHAQQEIAAAGKQARAELKAYSAELAVALAEQRLREGMTPDTQEALVRGFVRDLNGASPQHPA